MNLKSSDSDDEEMKIFSRARPHFLNDVGSIRTRPDGHSASGSRRDTVGSKDKQQIEWSPKL